MGKPPDNCLWTEPRLTAGSLPVALVRAGLPIGPSREAEFSISESCKGDSDDFHCIAEAEETTGATLAVSLQPRVVIVDVLVPVREMFGVC